MIFISIRIGHQWHPLLGKQIQIKLLHIYICTVQEMTPRDLDEVSKKVNCRNGRRSKRITNKWHVKSLISGILNFTYTISRPEGKFVISRPVGQAQLGLASDWSGTRVINLPILPISKFSENKFQNFNLTMYCYLRLVNMWIIHLFCPKGNLGNLRIWT